MRACTRPGHPPPRPWFTRAARLLAGTCACLMVLTPDVSPGAERDAASFDPETGLRMAQDWDLVRANCTGCHSARLITQQRASRETWLGLIRWMQETQGLWPIPVPIENRILDYLAAQYPPRTTGRRAPLPRSLRPPSGWDDGVTRPGPRSADGAASAPAEK
jgi:hypothetical protein